MSREREQGLILSNAINASAAILALIDSYSGDKMIHQGYLLPLQWPLESTTLNFYPVQGQNGGEEFGNMTWALVCRSAQEIDADNLADAVYDNLNRSYQDSYFLKCDTQPIVPPLDGADNFNRTVEITVRNT